MQIGLLVFKNDCIKQFTFSKQERLKSRKLVEHLFSKGKSFSAFPVKVLYDFVDLKSELALQAGVTVSSRNFKKAVERNRVKRILRESYRLQKLPLKDVLESNNKQLALFFIYIGKELPQFEDISEKVRTIIKKLVDAVEKTSIEKN